MICFIGLVFMGNVTKHMQGEVDTSSKVFYSAASMAWINIIVQTVIPDATAVGIGYAEIVSTLALACLLQVCVNPTPFEHWATNPPENTPIGSTQLVCWHEDFTKLR